MINSRVNPGHVALFIPNHGYYQTTASSMDDLMAEYLPDSPAGLRRKVQQIADETQGAGLDYSDLKTVTECLLVIAELTGRATN